MLTIRKAQIEALAEHQRANFRRQLIAHLTSVLEAKGIQMDPQTLHASVERGIADTAGFGFRTEQQVAQWVEIACVELGGFRRDHTPNRRWRF
jgi:hypothetical protein